MLGNFMSKANKFIETYRSLLIVFAIAIGLFNAYQTYQSKQVRFVEGWSCSYWDAKRNQMQGLIEDELRNRTNSSLLYSNTKERDRAAEIFNKNCLPDSAYLFKD
jgi:hypothetical protein